MTNPRDDLMALAPCPFCGGDVRPETYSADYKLIEYCVVCPTCDFSTAEALTAEQSAARWNTRAAPRPATQVVDREAVARAICQSGKFETGEGTCALLCMDQLGSPRKKGCCHSARVHGKLANSILSLLRSAEPVEAEHPALKWSLSNDAIRQLSEIDENIRHAAIASPGMKAGGIQPSPDAVGEQATEAAVKEIVTHPPKSPDISAEMAQFRKKTDTIEAVRFDVGREHKLKLPRGVHVSKHSPGADNFNYMGFEFRVDALGGPLLVEDGDWIIYERNGDIWACKPDIFEATYEPA